MTKMRYIFRSYGDAARLQREVGILDELNEKKTIDNVDVFHTFKTLSVYSVDTSMHGVRCSAVFVAVFAVLHHLYFIFV